VNYSEEGQENIKWHSFDVANLNEDEFQNLVEMIAMLSAWERKYVLSNTKPLNHSVIEPKFNGDVSAEVVKQSHDT
jgi:hypothetical protein